MKYKNLTNLLSVLLEHLIKHKQLTSEECWFVPSDFDLGHAQDHPKSGPGQATYNPGPVGLILGWIWLRVTSYPDFSMAQPSSSKILTK